MTTWLRCPGCQGEVGTPDGFSGDLQCPKCSTVILSVDPETKVMYKAAGPSPGWMKPWGYVLTSFAVFAFVASGIQAGGGTLLGFMICGVLNPIFFVGMPLGLYWLRRTNVI